MDIFETLILGSPMIVLAIGAALFALNERYRAGALRIMGVPIWALLACAGAIPNSTGCSPFIVILVGPLVAIGLMVVVGFLPRTRVTNIVLWICLALAPLAGMLLGHAFLSDPNSRCDM
jgi:hypothetical protein